ncbi:Peptidase, M23/M37 family protein [uncultured Pleomorphomonas sp.]|uniref:Peptidase, M23/M37 family protein n=1 Tax=uncultured Pleomorphomonas sp. TaxID=442121 RepID=A0A212LLW7_9HYPH|nr:M23 family metallopeptidase [uncultured Pleomorphomonas sp.]SCM78525.1 Peptidase, M23/M37 family protein [uncultured Pleomorphomonas sp.]
MNAARPLHRNDNVELGDLPPLLTSGARGLPDRRGVSIRWLTGTVMATFASTFLMGGALYAAFDGRETIAEPSGTVTRSAVVVPTPDDEMIAKGDFPVQEASVEPARQILKVSTIAKDGEHDIIRLKPFAKVSTALVSDMAEITDPIPPYNPLRIFADANAGSPADGEATLYGAAIESDMMLKVTDFPVNDPSLEASIPLDIAQTERIVREAASFLNGTNVKTASLSPVDQSRFDFGFAEPSSLDQFGVRIIPENVSFVPTTTAEPAASGTGNAFEDRRVAVEADEPLEQLLTDNEATDDEAGDIVLAFHKADRLRLLKAGDEVRIRLAPDPDDETTRYRPILVSVYRDGGHLGSVGLGDDGSYIAVDEPPATEQVDAGTDGDENSPRPRLYESLYETSLKNGVPPALIDELVRVFSFDLDLNTRIQPGDSFQMVYTLGDNGEETDNGEIVFTSITLGGKERRFYRYRAPDDGSVDYYDDSGKSAKKFLMRKPMSGGTFRSGFGARNHPLLGVTRMHTGVDWAAPRGTPIMAAGDGIVTYARWKNGYGNYIEVQHTNGYASAYAHQTGFAKGIKEGVRVRQGQVIGYVGTTGLSTGPHLHYEVHVNGTPVDPLRIKLPQGRTLDGDILAAFQSERDRVDTLLAGDSQTARAATAPASGG